MGGFIKGIAVGLGSFVLGFVVLSVAVPVDPGPESGVQADLAPGTPGALTSGTPASSPEVMPASAAPAPAQPEAPVPAQGSEPAVETPTAPMTALPGVPTLPGATGAEATAPLASLAPESGAAQPVPAPPPADSQTERAPAVAALPSVRAGAMPPVPVMPASGGTDAAPTLAAPAPLATAATPVERTAPDAPTDRPAPIAALPGVTAPPAPAEPALPTTADDTAQTLATPAPLATAANPVEPPAPDAPTDRPAPIAALPGVTAPPAPAEPALPTTAADAAPALAAPAPLATAAAPVERTAPDAPTDRAAPIAALPGVVVPQDTAEPGAPSAPTDDAADNATDTAAAPSPIDPVAATATPTGEPLLTGAGAERPPVSVLPTAAPGVVIGRGSIGDGSVVRRGGGETLGRLPTIGETPVPAATAEPGPAEATGPAVERFAAAPQIEEGEAPMGVVLTDDPAAETAILALPVPVTIAMDPYDPDAPRRAEAYRRAGHEIALSALNLPGLASDPDLATIIEAWHRTFPEAVAVIDVPLNGLGANPTLARNFAAALAPEGYGVIALRDGLDAFLQAARSRGMRAASVYRMIDASDQSDVALRRLIDRAAFEALRQPGVLIAGSAADRETMRALGAFARGEGRAGVALVPASAILNRN